jgi:hypothetical protein
MTTKNDNPNHGSGGTNVIPGGENETIPKKDVVSYETYSRVLDEAKAVKAKLKEHEDILNKTKEDKLKSDGDWKGLLELRDSRIKELQEESEAVGKKYQGLNERIVNSQKLSSVISKLGGSLDSKYYGLIDLNDIKTNPDTGEIDDMSAAKVAESFKVQYPETIKKGFNPNAMGESGNGSNSGVQTTINQAEWLKLPYKEQKKWKVSQIK